MSVDTESAGLHAHIVVLGPSDRRAPLARRTASSPMTCSLNLVL